MEKGVTTRQACLLVMFSMIGSKLLICASMMSYQMTNNAWIAFAISFLIDFMFCLLMIYLIKTVDMPLLDYIKLKFGKVVAIIIASVVTIMFAVKLAELLLECHLFFTQLLFVETKKLIFIFCFVVILFFFGTRKFEGIGRSAEMLIYLVLFSLIVSIVISFQSADASNILPLRLNLNTTVRTIFAHNMWFGDFWILAFCVGRIRIEKNTAKKLVWSYLISVAIVLTFVVVFTMTFGLTASLHRMCVVDITEISPRLLDEGRLNWLVYFIFPIALIFCVGIYSNCTCACTRQFLFEKEKNKSTISATITCVIVVAICFLMRFELARFYGFIQQYYCYFVAVVQYVLPLILVVAVSLEEKKAQKKPGAKLQKKLRRV